MTQNITSKMKHS